MAKPHFQKQGKEQESIPRCYAAESILDDHPLFGYNCHSYWYVVPDRDRLVSKKGNCVLDGPGRIAIDESKSLTANQWAFCYAHCLLHMVFGHLDCDNIPLENGTCNRALWNKACDIYVTRFLYDIQFGSPICPDPALEYKIKLNDERKIYAHLKYLGDDGAVNPYGTNGGAPDLLDLEHPIVYKKGQVNPFAKNFAEAMNRSINDAISTAGGHTWDSRSETPIKKASEWFLTHYPLLGSLAASFKVIEDANLCIKNEIHIAAVDPAQGEIYCNPTTDLATEEWRFVLAHEYLHAGLMHHKRCAGRDRYLWNVACDYCVNSWLVEMQIGQMPKDGLLYDKELQGLSAESIYDIIVKEMRKYRRLGTFRGYGRGDIISDSLPKFGGLREAVSLDEFFRNSLREGLDFHQSNQRGFLPAGLVEEIRALTTPPIPWDVELAQWFDQHFPPLEKHRSYARPSRRQGATPDIPRPSYVLREEDRRDRTFGVVVDTSGSMPHRLLGLALGAIASYASAKEVRFVRVIFCDAEAYDAGYLSPEELADRVKVTGGGGTVLQPVVDLLEHAKDLPFTMRMDFLQQYPSTNLQERVLKLLATRSFWKKEMYKMNFELHPGYTLSGKRVTWSGADNPHLYISGQSGTGKSFLLKRLASQAVGQGAFVLTLDYSSDFLDYTPPDGLHFQRINVSSPEFSLNPLIGRPGQTADARAQQLLAALHSVFRMGPTTTLSLHRVTTTYLTADEHPTMEGLLALSLN